MKQCDILYPTDQLRAELKVDSVRSLMYKDTCKTVFKGYRDMGPEPINMFIPYTNERNLRSDQLLLVQTNTCHTQFGDKNIRVPGRTYWNHRPTEIKEKSTSESF